MGVKSTEQDKGADKGKVADVKRPRRRKGCYKGRIMETLQLFEKDGPMTQGHLAKSLGITAPAAHDRFQRLGEEGLLVSIDKKSAVGRGRPTKIWDIDKSRNFTVGLCMVPPMLLMGLGNFGDMVLLKEEQDLSEVSSHEEIIEVVDAFIDRAQRYITEMQGVLRSVYISQCGQLDLETGAVIKSINMPILAGLDMESYIRQKYEVACHSYNHRYAFHWGEVKHLPEDTTLTVIDWDLGVGITTGCNDRLYTIDDKRGVMKRGIRDIGHIRIVKDGRLCHCGDRGCLEAYTGGWAILEQLNRPDVKKLADIIRLSEQGDEQVLDALAAALRVLGEQVSWIVRLFGTERLIFTGPLSRVYPLGRFAFAEGLSKSLTEEEIKTLNPLASPDPLSRIVAGACHMGKHLFFYPDAYFHTRELAC